MTIKKIFAGVLAAASVLSVSATAFAAPEAPDKTKAVTKPGETEYEAGVSMMGAELDVELPGNMKAFLNPYGAEVAIDEETTPNKMKTGVVSWAYEVVNNTKDFGIFIDAKKVKGTPSTGVSIASAAPANGKKEVYMSLVFAKDGAALKAVTAPAASSMTDNTQKVAHVAITASETSQAKFGYVPGKTDTDTTSPKGVIGFVGNISKQGSADASDATKVTDWTDDDTVTVTYTLKISPAPAAAVAADFT